MAFRFGSEEWARSLQDVVNSSSEYRNSAAKWGVGFNGNVLLAFEADAALPQPHNLMVRLAGGSCQGAAFVEDSQHPAFPNIHSDGGSADRQFLDQAGGCHRSPCRVGRKWGVRA